MELSDFYRKQKDLDNLILQKTLCLSFVQEEDHVAFLTHRFLAAYVELGELANEVECFKYWKENKRNDRDKKLKEYVDFMHFFLSLGNTLGFKPHEIENAYNEKYEENILRQQNHY